LPLLIVEQETPLFESAVINEYVDELTPPRLLPQDPLQRALSRAWIAFGSDMIMAMHRWMTAPTEEAFRDARDEAVKGLVGWRSSARRDPVSAGPTSRCWTRRLPLC
jgi:glutathione S-transferase